MAWVVDEKASTIASVWNTSLCFQMRLGGGAELESCDGSPQQNWTLKKHAATMADEAASYQIVSSTGQCIADVSKPSDGQPRAAATGLHSAVLSFDVRASLGWPKGAKVHILMTFVLIFNILMVCLVTPFCSVFLHFTPLCTQFGG